MSFINTAYAASGGSLDTFLHNVNRLIVNPLITLLFAVALVIFLYGIVEFLMNAENDEKRTTGKQHMVWGIVGLTVMIGVFAILNVVLKTFGINDVDVEQQTVELDDYSPTYPSVGR